MTETMRAATIGMDRVVTIVDDVPRPEVSPGQALVRLLQVGVCGTDYGYVTGERDVPRDGWILGHEGNGIVVAVGSNVSLDLVGTRVAIEPNFPCGLCPECRDGATALCADRGSLALNEPGLFAEYAAVPAEYCWALPDGVADDVATVVEPVAVCLAAIRRAGITDRAEGLSVLVVGAGALGLLLATCLRELGASVDVLERDSDRRARADDIGVGRYSAERQGTYAVVFDSTGTASGGAAAIANAARNARVVVIGVGNDPVPCDTRLLVRRGLTVIGSMIYDHPHDFEAAISFLTERRIALSPSLGDRYSLAEVATAFERYPSSVGKTIIQITQEAAR